MAYLQTPIGLAEFEGDENGLSAVRVLDQEKPIGIIPEALEDAVYQFQEYFEGKRKNFDLKLNPSGTYFQKTVWKLLQEISFGKTVSYLELSKKLGDPKAIRAVASANGKNPLWIIVPCHRVIGSNGDLVRLCRGTSSQKMAFGTRESSKTDGSLLIFDHVL